MTQAIFFQASYASFLLDDFSNALAVYEKKINRSPDGRSVLDLGDGCLKRKRGLE